MKERGMTLLETMIAMAILALVGIALMSSDAEKIRNFDRLQEKQLAAWAAENAAAEIKLSGGLTAMRSQLKKVWMGNSQFFLSIKSITTSGEGIHRIKIDVAPLRDRQAIIFSLDFYLVVA